MFSYWSKFHVNIITGSRVVTIFLYKELTRNLEIENIWVSANIWRLARFRDTKFGWKVSNEMLLNAAKARITAFTVSQLLKETQQGAEGVKLRPPPFTPRLGLKRESTQVSSFKIYEIFKSTYFEEHLQKQLLLNFLPVKTIPIKISKEFCKIYWKHQTKSITFRSSR